MVLYTLFFIGFATFLLVNSFGYRFNTNKRTIENSASIAIKTAPTGAQVLINPGNKTSTTPADLTLSDSGAVELTLSKDGYINENFKIYYPGGSNSTTFLDRIYLLPSQPANQIDYKDSKALSFLTDTQIVTLRNKALFVDTVTSNSIANSAKITTSVAVDTSVTIRFEPIGDNSYWEPTLKLLLTLQNSTWFLTSLPNLSQPIKSVIANSSNSLILTTGGELWSWNYINPPQFVDSAISGITFTNNPKSFWLWKNNWIKQITLSPDISEQLSSKNASLTSNILITASNSSFAINAVYQGFAYKLGSTLLYRGDYENADFTVLDNDVELFVNAGDSVYWKTKDSKLLFANMRSQVRKTLSDTIPTTINALFYDSYWSRVMLYSPAQVYSIWHNNDRENSTIQQYSLVQWLSDSECSQAVSFGTQICSKGGSIEIYINRSLLF
jgi:PEGA domain